MPVDSQAVTRLMEDKTTAQNRLQKVTELLADAQQDVDRYTLSSATLVDEIADIDAAIAAAIALP